MASAPIITPTRPITEITDAELGFKPQLGLLQQRRQDHTEHHQVEALQGDRAPTQWRHPARILGRGDSAQAIQS